MVNQQLNTWNWSQSVQILTALQKKPQPGQHWCFTMPLRWSSHKTSSWTELEGRIISCFSIAPWQRVSCPSTLSVAMHFLSARMRISRLLGVSMRQLHSGSSWASSMAAPKVSAKTRSPPKLHSPQDQFKFVSLQLTGASNNWLAGRCEWWVVFLSWRYSMKNIFQLIQPFTTSRKQKARFFFFFYFYIILFN